MRLHCTFVQMKYDETTLELAHAWDEYCVESNYEGFVESRDAALAGYGEDLLRSVEVAVDVPMGKVWEALMPIKVTAEVESVTAT